MSSKGLPPILSLLVNLLKANRPQGIALMDITKELYNLYGFRLNINDYNYKNLYEMIEELSKKCGNSVVLVKHSSKLFKSDRLFMDEVAYEQWFRKYINKRDIEALESLVTPILPEDVPIQHKTDRVYTCVPSDAFNRHRITSFKVDVIHVESPNHLFVRLKQNKQIYNNLRQMLRFYDGKQEQTDHYILPKELAVEGYLCAVKNPKDWDNWHRAVIRKTTDDDQITLYAIDFGNIIIKDRKELRLLKASMVADPPQIIKVSLAAIAPSASLDNNYLWSDSCVEYLRSTVTKYKMNIAVIFLYPLDTNYFSAFLQSSVRMDGFDIPYEFPIYFHELLIRKGFADMIEKDFNELNAINSCKEVLPLQYFH